MTCTLAEMTDSERAECVGRWCEDLDGDLVILESSCVRRTEGQVVVGALYPPTRDRLEYLASELMPRPDLPRAWTPAGEPVPGEWADGYMWWGEDTDTMQTVDLVSAECIATGQVQGLGEWPEGVTPGEDVPVRRYITDWEEA